MANSECITLVEGGSRIKGNFKNSSVRKPLISIITVVYNGEKHLEATIQSVITQTYDNVEYIIIDGESTDGTLDIIQKYEDKIDYWMSERDSGIYDAMNKGINLCKGSIIGIVNADDLIYLNTLKNISIAFQDPRVMFTYGSIDLAHENGEVFASAMSIGIKSLKYILFKHMPFLHPTMFLRSEVYTQIGKFNISYKLSADYDFCLRLVENNFIGQKLDFATGVFRLGGQSGGMKSYRENQTILLEHGVNPLIVYFSNMVLIVKMWFRSIFNR